MSHLPSVKRDRFNSVPFYCIITVKCKNKSFSDLKVVIPTDSCIGNLVKPKISHCDY